VQGVFTSYTKPIRAHASISENVYAVEMRIAPVLGTEEKAVLFAGMCNLEGHYHRETQIWSQNNDMFLFTGLVLFIVEL
jgi:hypothetical protein